MSALVAINRLSAIRNQFRSLSTTANKVVHTASAPAAIGPYCTFSDHVLTLVREKGTVGKFPSPTQTIVFKQRDLNPFL